MLLDFYEVLLDEIDLDGPASYKLRHQLENIRNMMEYDDIREKAREDVVKVERLKRRTTTIIVRRAPLKITSAKK